MLDLRTVVAEQNRIVENLNRRGGDFGPAVKELVGLDETRRELIQKAEALKQDRNAASQEIASRKREKKDASELLDRMKQVSAEIKQLDERLGVVEDDIASRLLLFPNLLDDTVPTGTSDAENREERKVGNVPTFGFEARAHHEIGEASGILAFEKAGQVTGARFVFLLGIAAKLERALINFMLAEHAERGYEEICPPFIVNESALVGTGQFPKFKEDVFKLEGLDYYLIPTAEVPVTNFHRDEILERDRLPRKYVAYTPCFRSEAGSYGKDTKGMKRQHQFDKVELVKIVEPERSPEELESLVGDAENILKKLELPYRVVTLCSADTGFASSKTYDIEVWSPGARAYMEISSCSNFRDFQARRAKIRLRNEAKKVQFAHTLNGSGLAVGRTLIAIMENFQKEDGSFEVPSALRKYL